jgi:hypothetical protein
MDKFYKLHEEFKFKSSILRNVLIFSLGVIFILIDINSLNELKMYSDYVSIVKQSKHDGSLKYFLFNQITISYLNTGIKLNC